MNKRQRQEYKDKLEYIIKYSSDVDTDWFSHKGGKLLFVYDRQQHKDKSCLGYLAITQCGSVYYRYVETGNNHPIIINHESQKKDFDIGNLYYALDLIMDNVSVNNMLWKINRIYDDLRRLHTEYPSYYCH